MYKTASVATLRRGKLHALKRANKKGTATLKESVLRREIRFCFFMDAWQTI
jgi:hypothetical protein